MEAIVINDIKLDLSIAALHDKLTSNSGALDPVMINLVETARTIARPRAAFLIQERGKDFVVIDKFRIYSRVLRVNFGQTQRVFPFIATCANEVEDWANSQVNEVHRVWARRICELALETAIETLIDHIEAGYLTGPTSKVNPGSTIDWPLEGQRELFQLLDKASELVGVSLKEDLWMIPSISSSGIRYPSKEPFENCSLCPMEDCRLRKAPYQIGLYEQAYMTE